MKKAMKRFAALALTLALAVSVFAVNAFAATDGSAAANPKLTKKLTVEGESATLPLAETFKFTVEADGKSDDTTYENPGADAITVGTAAFGKGAENGDEEEITVTVDTTKFAGKPGTYYYKVTEVEGSTDGMTYSSAEKKLAVQVLADGTCTYYIVENGDNDKDDGEFENEYTAHKLTVKKTIKGNQADPNEKFEIKVTVDGAEGETYPTNKDNVTLTSGTAYTFELKGGESVEIYNLSPADKYTVDEADKYAQTEDYTVTGEVTTATAIGEEDAEVEIINEKDATPPTGVIMTIAPYALMVVLAGAFAVVFLTRRNRAE